MVGKQWDTVLMEKHQIGCSLTSRLFLPVQNSVLTISTPSASISKTDNWFLGFYKKISNGFTTLTESLELSWASN